LKLVHHFVVSVDLLQWMIEGNKVVPRSLHLHKVSRASLKKSIGLTNVRTYGWKANWRRESKLTVSFDSHSGVDQLEVKEAPNINLRLTEMTLSIESQMSSMNAVLAQMQASMTSLGAALAQLRTEFENEQKRTRDGPEPTWILNADFPLHYDGCVEYARSRNARLPTQAEVRKMIERGNHLPLFDEDIWIPVSDRHNDWVYVGNCEVQKCLGNLHTSLGGPADWGTVQERKPFRKHLAIVSNTQ
jgi:hypothetical protein